jgi:Fe-S-cluster containining protein
MTLELPTASGARRELLLRYVALMDRDIDPAFAMARGRYPSAIPCAKGCSLCCAGLFAINQLDAALIREGLLAAPPDVRRDVMDKVRALMERVREAAPDWESPWLIERLGWGEFARLAAKLDSRCPALGAQDECLVYAHRPRVGRLQGLTWRDPETGEVLDDFCAEIFGSPAYAAIPPQPLPRLTENGVEVAELREDWRRLTGDGGHTFVAAALAVQGAG